MRFVLVCFLFMGWAFYELSGGADFEPRRPEGSVDVADAGPVRLTAGTDVVVPDPEKVATVIDAPEVVRLQPVVVKETPIEPAAADTPSLTFRFNHSGAESDAANVQLASLADGQTAFPQPVFLNPSAEPSAPTAEAAPEPDATPADIREVTGSRVNVRQGPGTTYTVIGTLYYDDRVEILEDLGNGWVQLRKVGDDRVGWMAARFVGKPVN